MKNIAVLTKKIESAVFYKGILKELWGESAQILNYSVDDESLKRIQPADLYVSAITNYDILLDNWITDYMPDAEKIVEIELTFSKASIELLQTYPEGTKALLINQNKHMTMESISQIYHLGISNIEFYPYYPGAENVPELNLAFTPGETDLAPKNIKKVIDIGDRLMTINTISEIALKLGDHYFLESDHFRKYLKRLSALDFSIENITSKNLTMENRLELIINSLDEGILCLDENGIITLINKTARTILDASRSETQNHKITEIIPNFPIDFTNKETLNTSHPQLLTIKGRDIGVTAIPMKLHEQFFGTFFKLQDFSESERAQNNLRRQKTRKSHQAIYHFEDIIGKAPEIMKAKEIALRVAASNAPILIDGESGSGKEVFAQAIHNASSRAAEAFVTINCASLNDDILESELFGVSKKEDVSGTVVSGKTGLIEYAHLGTLFLDGIEYMSSRMQASLIRVLREKEILPIGSEEPIPVDVRIISTANENLLKKVQEGSFRKELYYRLNVIPLHIPSLREHQADISVLIRYFMKKLDADFELTDRAKVTLLQHHWEGNVRELRNCIEYLKYAGLHTVDYDDLPEIFREKRNKNELREEVRRLSGMDLHDYWILRELGEVYPAGHSLGRQKIVQNCHNHGDFISEYEVREILKKFEKEGLAVIAHGRGGTKLTENGYLKYRRIVHGETEKTEKHT